MSTIVVTTVQSANSTTDLTIKTGNTGGAQIVLGVNGQVGIIGPTRVNRNQPIYLDGTTSNTYIAFNGTNIVLVKNGTQVATW